MYAHLKAFVEKDIATEKGTASTRSKTGIDLMSREIV